MPAYAGYAQGYAPAPATWDAAVGGPAAYGTRPTVPSPAQTAGSAIGGNIGNLGSIYGLGGGLNRFQAQQAASQVGQNLPGYQDLITKSSGNIQSMLGGQVPEDVVTQIIQSAGERGIMTGSPGSPNANASLLRALGLTSLQMQQTGEGELTAAIGRTPTGGLFQPSSMLVSPDQQQAAEAAGRLYASGPDPSAAAAASFRTATSGLGAGLGSVGAPTLPMGGQVGGQIGAGFPGYGGPTGMNYGGVTYDQPPVIGGPSSWGNAYGNVSLPIRDEPAAPMITTPGQATWSGPEMDQWLSDVSG